MAKEKASNEGNNIGVDLAKSIATAINRTLSSYDFSPLNKSLTKGLGKIEVSSLLKANDAKVKQLAIDAKSVFQKEIGNIKIAPTIDAGKIAELQKSVQESVKAPTVDTASLEKAGDLVRTLINLTDQANKKTKITADLYKQIIQTTDKLVSSKRMEKEAAEDIAKAYQVKLPPLKLNAAVQSIDTKAIDEQVKKLDLIGLQALVTEVDVSLVNEEINKLNPLAFTSIVDFDSNKIIADAGKLGPIPLEATISNAGAPQTPAPTTPTPTAPTPTPEPNPGPFDAIADAENAAADAQQRRVTGRINENASLVTQSNMAAMIAGIEEERAGAGRAIAQVLKDQKITYAELDGIVATITGGAGELTRVYSSSNETLEKAKQIQQAINAASTQAYANEIKANTEKKTSATLDSQAYQNMLKIATESESQTLAEMAANGGKEKAQQAQQEALRKTSIARERIIKLLESEGAILGLSEGAMAAMNQTLSDESNLLQEQLEATGLKGDLLKYTLSEREKGVALLDIEKQAGYLSLKTLQKSLEKRTELLQAEGEGIAIAKALNDSRGNLNQMFRETLQHSNTLFFDQVNVNELVEQQKETREELLELAKRTGAAGEGSRSLLKAETDLFKTQVDLAGYAGEAAAYIVEQLGKQRTLSEIQNDTTLKTLEAGQKSIDFRKKDLDLQIATKKKIEEIKESHEGIKDRIKQTLDFSKELAKDPKAFGMFAAAAVGSALGHATHQLHDLMEEGMSAGGAISVMSDSITVMGTIGLSKVADVNREIMKQFGNMAMMTKDQRDSVGVMAKSYGLAGEEAANLALGISRMPGESMETAANFGKTAENIAKTAGVDTGVLLKDMAKNSGLLSTYSKGGAEGFAKAAASAKKMGVELSSVLNAAEKTLDFESSISAQMEANVLLGKSMNFDKLRAAALSGDANAIMQEQSAIMQQVGSLDNMNVLQKKKLAEAMGMTVEEMTKFNEAQQHQNEYFGESAGPVKNFMGTMLKVGGAIGETVSKYGMQALAIGQFLVQLATLKAAQAGNAATTLAAAGATNVDTASQLANGNASKLNAAQMKVFKELRATDVPAQRAMTLARASDTIAMGTNTGAQGLNQSVAKKGILLRIQDRISMIGQSITKGGLTILTNLATAAETFYNTTKEKGIVVATLSLAKRGVETVTKGLSTAATYLETKAEASLAGQKNKNILGMLRGIAIRVRDFAFKQLGITYLLTEAGAEGTLNTAKQKSILTNLKDTAKSIIRTTAKLFGITVLATESAAETALDNKKKLTIGTTNTRTALSIRERLARLLGISTMVGESAAETGLDAKKKMVIATSQTKLTLSVRERLARLLGIGTMVTENTIEGISGATKTKNMGITSTQTLKENARRLGRFLGIGVTAAESTAEGINGTIKKRGLLSTIALTAVTLARNIVVGAGNIVLGIANGLLSFFGVNTAVAGTAGATAAPGIAALGTATGVAGAAMIPTVPIILAFGLAILMATPAIYVLGEVLKTLAVVVGNILIKALEMLPAIIGAVAAGFVTIFSTIAQNFAILFPLGAGLGVVAIGLAALGVAAYVAAPGMLAMGVALLLMTPALLVFKTMIDSVQSVSGSLTALAAVAPALLGVGAAVLAIGTGLGIMALAGMAAMPIIGALIALATVAPALASIGGMTGMGGGGAGSEGGESVSAKGGGGEKEDSTNALITEIRALITEMSKGGIINMDGKKVGDVIALAMPSRFSTK